MQTLTMASPALLALKASPLKHTVVFGYRCKTLDFCKFRNDLIVRNCSSATASSSSSLQPPDVPRLAETARISLTENEVEEFGPKIRQVIDWFGQLQAVDLNSVEPAIRADTEGENLREDVPETFENREALIASVPSYEDAYIKVPKVLNKE